MINAAGVLLLHNSHVCAHKRTAQRMSERKLRRLWCDKVRSQQAGCYVLTVQGIAVPLSNDRVPLCQLSLEKLWLLQ